MAQKTENKIIPYSQHYLCSSELLGNKYQADKIFQYLFDRFLCNYRSNNQDTGMFLFSKQKIEQSTGVERHTVSKGLKRLMDLGLISAEGNSCIVYYSYYNAVIRLFSFANSDDKIAIKKAFESGDKAKLEELGMTFGDENTEDEVAILSRGGINVPDMVKSCQHGKKLPSMVENYHDGKKLPCFDEDFWNNFTTMVKNYHDGKKLPYDSESFSSSLLDMVKSCHSDVNLNDIQALLIQLGIDFMVKSCQAYGKKLPNTPDFMVTFYHSNINNIINNKKSNNEHSELYKGENKEKVEVEEELEDDGKLPVDLNNFYDSFLENSLGISSLKIKRTSSNENFIDRVMSTETFQDQIKSDSQLVLQKQQDTEITFAPIKPVWHDSRNLDYPLFPVSDVRRILEFPEDYSEDIHKVIRTVWNELIAPLPDEDREGAGDIDELPVDIFYKQLKQIIQQFKEEDPEFSITLEGAVNIFGFDARLDEEKGEFYFQISQRQLHDIRESQLEEKHSEGTVPQLGRNEKHLYQEAFDEIAEQDDDASLLTPIEKAVYFMKYDMEQIMNKELTLDGASRGDKNVLFVEYYFNQEVDGWAREAGVDPEDLRQLAKVFRRQTNKVVVRPTKIEAEKIIDWNKQHSQESKVEKLWQQKMAELQN